MQKKRIHPGDWFKGLIIGFFISLLAYLSISFYQGNMSLLTTGAIFVTAVMFLLLILLTIKKPSSE